MCLGPNDQILEVLHRNGLLTVLARSQELEAALKAFYKILSRHLPYFAAQLQLEEGGEDF